MVVLLAALVLRAPTMVLLPLGVVSLLSRLPLGSTPGVALATPPRSLAVTLSTTALGSLAPDPSTVMYRMAALVAPAPSRIV
ncbi:hypothetical protein D3C85_460920 [compost metagenome]